MWSFARRVGISALPCLRRVRGLEEAGYIKGYRALLDEKLLGCEVTVFAMVHLSSQAESDLIEFERFVRSQPLVRECWMLSGEIDSHPQMRRARPQDVPGIRLPSSPRRRMCATSRPSLTLRTSKDEAAVPMQMIRVST